MTHHHPHAEYSHRHYSSLKGHDLSETSAQGHYISTRNLPPYATRLLSGLIAARAVLGEIQEPHPQPHEQVHHLRTEDDRACVLGLLENKPFWADVETLDCL